jgi:hypothetical protein
VLSWLFLVAAAIHKEPPAGDRQFWVTRPYQWKSLLAAKALLIFAFINAPLFLADVAILAAHGLAPVGARLLMRQALVAGILLVPGAALAAVTRDQAQTVGAMLAAPVSLALVSAYTEGNGWGPLAWMHAWIVFAVLAAATLGVLVWQYARRRTAVARGVLAAGAGLCLAIVAAPPTGAAFALYGPEPEAVRTAHLCFVLSSAPCGGPVREEQDITGWFPIRIEGLPAGMKAEPLLLDLKIEAPNGASWRSGWFDWSTGSAHGIGWNWGWLAAEDGVKSRRLDANIGAGLVDRFQSQPVKLSLSLAMTIYRTEATTSLIPGQPPRAIAGIGDCSVDWIGGFFRPLLSCRTAGYPTARLEVNDTTIFGEQLPDRAMFEASPVFGPMILQEPVAADISPLVLTTERPIAHIRRDLEIERVRFLRPDVVKP